MVGDQLTKGNGDAFRHAYWNAILVPNMGGSSGAVYGEEEQKLGLMLMNNILLVLIKKWIFITIGLEDL